MTCSTVLGSRASAAPAASARVVVAVAAGGALGAGLRWAAGTVWAHEPGTWPWATLAVNIAGCLVIGVAARCLRPSTVAWAFAVTGVLGGFTTFSSFAVEVDDLIESGRSGVALAYVAVTLAAGIGATWIASRTPAPAGPVPVAGSDQRGEPDARSRS